MLLFVVRLDSLVAPFQDVRRILLDGQDKFSQLIEKLTAIYPDELKGRNITLKASCSDALDRAQILHFPLGFVALRSTRMRTMTWSGSVLPSSLMKLFASKLARDNPSRSALT